MIARWLSPAVLAMLLGGGTALAADRPIQDNSFLLEEAYNQEDGVIQHIFNYIRVPDTGGWSTSFTEEWPAPRLRHQASLSAVWLEPGEQPEEGSGFGDIALNYRLQLVGNGDAAVAMAPRLSLLAPTGAARTGHGQGGWGMQANLPMSIVLGPRVVAHTNLGYTWVRRGENEAGEKADTSAWNAGQSFVWLIHPRFNALVEFAWVSGESVEGPDGTDRFETFVVNPGVRWAHDFESGLQIVPGVSFPIGIGPSSGEQGILLYLSFEHPITAAARAGAREAAAGVTAP